MSSKWFDRQFDFNPALLDYDQILMRLKINPSRISKLVNGAPDSLLVQKTAGKWSVKEHIGHLSLLESLWRARIVDIKDGRPGLTPTDLANAATDEASFNGQQIEDLVVKFETERNATIELLGGIDAKTIMNKSFHPRLQTAMGIIDHLYFVAEHDDHHLEYVQEILKG